MKSTRTEATEMQDQFTTNDDNSAEEIATKILAKVIKFRRVPKSSKPCGDIDCPKCCDVYLPKILAAVQKINQ